MGPSMIREHTAALLSAGLLRDAKAMVDVQRGLESFTRVVRD